MNTRVSIDVENLGINWQPNTTYYVKVSQAFVQEVGGNRFFNPEQNIEFVTPGLPAISSTIPANNATGVSDPRITLNFDRIIAKNIGNIFIYEDPNTLVSTITITNNAISVEGVKLVINLQNIIQSGKTYYVLSDAGIIKDPLNFQFPGILENNFLKFTFGETILYVEDEPDIEFNIPLPTASVLIGGVTGNIVVSRDDVTPIVIGSTLTYQGQSSTITNISDFEGNLSIVFSPALNIPTGSTVSYNTPESFNDLVFSTVINGEKLILGLAWAINNELEKAGKVLILNKNTGELLNTIYSSDPAANQNFGSVLFTQNEYLVIRKLNTFVVYNLETNSVINEIITVGGEVSEVNGDYLIIGARTVNSGNGVVYLYNIKTAQLLHTITNPQPGGGIIADSFGQSISSKDDFLVIPSPYEDELVSINFLSVNAASDFSLAITTTGELWAWGSNASGRTGLGLTTGNTVGTTRVGSASNWATVSAGLNHSLAITTTGELWAWGSNASGRTGLGLTTGDTTVPTRVGSASNWASVSAGSDFSLAVTTTGELWAWGGNGFGQLGVGNTNQQTVPTRVGSASNWASVSAGSSHSIAVTTTGELWAWGNNSFGRTGLGSDSGSTLNPTRVGSASNWASVSAGSAHSISITTTGQLWAWGSNSSSQLGLGDTTQRTSPTRVGSASNWASVSAGTIHSIAITATGELWAWGNNADGRTGLGLTSGTTTSPTRVGSASNWASIDAGDVHTLSLVNDNKLYSWGSNANGRTGLGLVTGNTTVPTLVGINFFDSGKIYVYSLSLRSLIYSINNPNSFGTKSDDYFGVPKIIGDKLFVGTPNEDSSSANNTGVVYIFNLTNGQLLDTIINPKNGVPINGSNIIQFGNRIYFDENYFYVNASSSTFIYNRANNNLLKFLYNSNNPVVSDGEFLYSGTSKFSLANLLE